MNPSGTSCTNKDKDSRYQSLVIEFGKLNYAIPIVLKGKNLFGFWRDREASIETTGSPARKAIETCLSNFEKSPILTYSYKIW